MVVPTRLEHPTINSKAPTLDSRAEPLGGARPTSDLVTSHRTSPTVPTRSGSCGIPKIISGRQSQQPALSARFPVTEGTSGWQPVRSSSRGSPSLPWPVDQRRRFRRTPNTCPEIKTAASHPIRLAGAAQYSPSANAVRPIVPPACQPIIRSFRPLQPGGIDATAEAPVPTPSPDRTIQSPA